MKPRLPVAAGGYCRFLTELPQRPTEPLRKRRVFFFLKSTAFSSTILPPEWSSSNNNNNKKNNLLVVSASFRLHPLDPSALHGTGRRQNPDNKHV